MTRNLWWGPAVGTVRSCQFQVTGACSAFRYGHYAYGISAAVYGGGGAGSTGIIQTTNETHIQYATMRTEWRL
jgi:hypothetical protein